MSRRSDIVNALPFSRVPLIFLWAAFAVWAEYVRCGLGGMAPSVTLVALAAVAMLLSGLTGRTFRRR